MNERPDCPSSSALDRLMQCSASHNMGVLATSWEQNKEEPSGDAEFGIHVHEALQQGNAKSLQTDEERMAFSVMNRQRHLFITGWRKASWVDSHKDEEELTEHRLWLHHGITPVFSGQADYILLAGHRALILDYKSLWNQVPQPADNHQLRSLATLLWLSHKELKEITIQVIASHHNYVHHVMGEQDLRAYLELLEATIRQVNQANTPHAGDWCKHCRGLLICPAVRKKASDLLASDSDGLLPSRLPKGESGAKILDDMTALASLIDKVKDHYKTVLASDPKALPGWCLQSRSVKKFKEGAIAHVFRMLEDKFRAGVFDLIDISVPRAFSGLNGVEQSALQEYVESTQSSPYLRKKKDNGIQKA